MKWRPTNLAEDNAELTEDIGPARVEVHKCGKRYVAIAFSKTSLYIVGRGGTPARHAGDGDTAEAALLNAGLFLGYEPEPESGDTA